MSRAPGSATRSVGLGLILLAAGRRRALDQFGGSVQAVLASLAPLIAFPLVAAALLVIAHRPRLAATFLLAALCDVLLAPVIADAFCGLWNRRPAWGRYVTVTNWAQWLVGFVSIALLLAAGALPAGIARPELLWAIAVRLYEAWLQYFLARNALGLSRGRAVLLTLAIVAAQTAVQLGPNAIARALGDHPPDLAALKNPQK
jgi:hypothetical protein